MIHNPNSPYLIHNPHCPHAWPLKPHISPKQHFNISAETVIGTEPDESSALNLGGVAAILKF